MQGFAKSNSTQWRMSRKAKLIFVPVFILAMINFFSFFIIAIHLGGDALNGHIKDGHYFLGSHGKFTEVSEDV